MGINPADLAALSIEEKLTLMSDLWDSIDFGSETPPLCEKQEDELLRRRAEGLSDPDATVAWTGAQAELRNKR
jgi:putative addiction module component (TIGR02574 family)